MAEKSICYWMPSNNADQGLTISAIDTNLCTHIVFSFLKIDSSGEIVYETRTPSFVKSQLKEMRAKSSKVKIMIAFGGWDEKLKKPWSELASSKKSRQNFANNVYELLESNSVHGVDIDWEFPDVSDRSNFVALIKSLKDRLGSKFSVSCAIGAGAEMINNNYDVREVFKHSDFVNVMTYSLHGSWEGKTGLHSALYSGPADKSDRNVHDTIQALLNQGAIKNKIILGIPAYAAAFKLSDNSKNEIGSPATAGVSETEPHFRDVCNRIKKMTYKFDDNQKSSYAYQGSLWFSFDDVRSVKFKAEYINENELGGAMFW